MMAADHGKRYLHGEDPNILMCPQVAVIACQLVVHCRRQADMGILQKPEFDDIVRKKSMQASDSS